MGRIARVLRALAANRSLARVSIAWLLFVVAEYAVWIGMLVYAYARGGATQPASWRLPNWCQASRWRRYCPLSPIGAPPWACS